MRMKRCSRCKLHLPLDAFDRVGRTGRWQGQCRVCKHERLAAFHAKEAEKEWLIRRRKRDAEKARQAAARAVLGERE